MLKYYGNYLIATETDWIAFANQMNIDLATLIPMARRSTNLYNGEYLWMLEIYDLSFAEELWAYKNGIYPLRQYQASQLGMPFLKIMDKEGQRILTDTGTIVPGKEYQAILWGRTVDPQMPWNLTQEQLIQYMVQNNIVTILQNVFSAFEDEPLITKNP